MMGRRRGDESDGVGEMGDESDGEGRGGGEGDQNDGKEKGG